MPSGWELVVLHTTPSMFGWLFCMLGGSVEFWTKSILYQFYFFWPWCESNCPRCDGYKTWRCIQEIHTGRDTNCQHLSKFTTLTKPSTLFPQPLAGSPENLYFLCLALSSTSADEMQGNGKSALQLGAENPTNVQIPKPTIVGTNENIFREFSTLMSFLFPHSAIHQFTKKIHSSSNLGCPLQPP